MDWIVASDGLFGGIQKDRADFLPRFLQRLGPDAEVAAIAGLPPATTDLTRAIDTAAAWVGIDPHCDRASEQQTALF